MRNPTALTRLAGITLAATMAVSCDVSVTRETTIDSPVSNPEVNTEAGATTGESSSSNSSMPDLVVPDDSTKGKSKGEPKSGEDEAEGDKAAETTDEAPIPPPANTSTWVVGGKIPSGLKGVPDIEIVEVRRNGTGPVCGVGKSATVRYKAMLADGTVKDPGPIYTFSVGAGRVIKGWDIAISKMRAGDSLVVLIPEGLAYAGQGTWKFEMELVSFK